MENLSNVLVLLMFIAIGVIHYQCHELIMEIRALRKLLKNDLDAHQKWLFDALYSIDNKVVLPEPKVEDETREPAKIYSPSQDPINSLKGMKNDWHGSN
jgi:hypothetical protein